MNRMIRVVLVLVIFFLFASFSFILHAFYVSPSHTLSDLDMEFAKDRGGDPNPEVLIKKFSDFLERGDIDSALPLLARARNENDFSLMKKALELEKEQGSLLRLASLIREAKKDSAQSSSNSDIIFSIRNKDSGSLLGEVIIRRNEVTGKYQIHSF